VNEHLNVLTESIIGAAIAVHRELGPGLLESTYERCLAFDLADRGLRFEQQLAIPLEYRGQPVGRGFRVDLLVEDLVIVEIKAVQRFEPIHAAQVLSYLTLSGRHIGILLNFNVRCLSEGGIKRLVMGIQL
jgi:GxxExxY protein